MTIVEKSREYSDNLEENGISCSDVSVAFQKGASWMPDEISTYLKEMSDDTIIRGTIKDLKKKYNNDGE